jgi:heme A synthase
VNTEHSPGWLASRSAMRGLAVATLISTYLLLVLGSTVRVTNSGMGCPGWPLCSGQAGPIDKFHPLMEQSHRYLATVVTVLIVLLVLAVVRAGPSARHVRNWAFASAAVIVVQIVLGAVTVFANNASWTVAAHLLVATLFLGVVTVTAVASFVSPDVSWSPRHGSSRLGWIAVVALFVIVTSGSLVVSGGAESACRSWPLCSSSPSSLSLIVIQMGHRSVVLVGSIVVVAYMVSLLRSCPRPLARRLAAVSLTLLALQVCAGAISALDGARAGAADVHLALASALWCAVVATFATAARGSVAKVLGVQTVGAGTSSD